MTTYAVIVRGAAVQPGSPVPGAVAPHPAAELPGPADTGELGERRCTEPKKDGSQCNGTPGDDGLCAAHKPAKTAE